jgi:hypothetical protein
MPRARRGTRSAKSTGKRKASVVSRPWSVAKDNGPRTTDRVNAMSNNGAISAPAWRAKVNEARRRKAEPLRLPSGATILAAKPEPLEWILSGRLPQRLLAGVLADEGHEPAGELSRDDILDLARFATQLVRASVVQPRIGEGPEEISLDDIPVEDRAFIFEWACRSLGQGAENPAAQSSSEEDLSSARLERFHAK